MTKKRNYGAWIIVAVTVAAILGVVLFGLLPKLLKPTTQVWIGDGVFKARVAVDVESRKNGLKEVTKMAGNEAFLAIYPTENKWSVDTGDTAVPIDVVWLNRDKKIIYIVKNISPNSAVESSYKPELAAKYVIELPGGSVDSKRINRNNTAIFQFDETGVK